MPKEQKIRIIDAPAGSAARVLGTGINVSPPGGLLIHNDMSGRDAPDAHPISAITGLRGELDAIDNHPRLHTLTSALDHALPAGAADLDVLGASGGAVAMLTPRADVRTINQDSLLRDAAGVLGLAELQTPKITAAFDLTIAPSGAIITDNIIRSTIFDAASGTGIFMDTGSATFRTQVLTPTLKNTGDLLITSDDVNGLINVNRVIQSTNFGASSGTQIDSNAGIITARGHVHTPEVQADSGLLIDAGGFITTDNVLRDSIGGSSIDLAGGIATLATEVRTPRVWGSTDLQLAASGNLELYPVGDVLMNGVQRYQQAGTGVLIDWGTGTIDIDQLTVNRLVGGNANDLEIMGDVITFSDHAGTDRVLLNSLGLRSANFRSSTADPIGWSLGDDEQEFANGIFNGKLRTTVFEIGNIMVTGGHQWITDGGGGLLYAAMSVQLGEDSTLRVQDPANGHFPTLQAGDVIRIRGEAWEHVDTVSGDSLVQDFLFIPRATVDQPTFSIRDAWFLVELDGIDEGDHYRYNLVWRDGDRGQWTWPAGTGFAIFKQIEASPDDACIDLPTTPLIELTAAGTGAPHLSMYSVRYGTQGCDGAGQAGIKTDLLLRLGSMEGLAIGQDGEYALAIGDLDNTGGSYFIGGNKRIELQNAPIIQKDLNGNEILRIEPYSGITQYLDAALCADEDLKRNSIEFFDTHTKANVLEIGVDNFSDGYYDVLGCENYQNDHLVGGIIHAPAFRPIDSSSDTWKYVSGTRGRLRISTGPAWDSGDSVSITLSKDDAEFSGYDLVLERWNTYYRRESLCEVRADKLEVIGHNQDSVIAGHTVNATKIFAETMMLAGKTIFIDANGFLKVEV